MWESRDLMMETAGKVNSPVINGEKSQTGIPKGIENVIPDG